MAKRSGNWMTIAEFCDELGVARTTFDDWRAKHRGPKCVRLPQRIAPHQAHRLRHLDRQPGGRRMTETTYDVRIWKITTRKNAKGKRPRAIACAGGWTPKNITHRSRTGPTPTASARN